VGRSQAAAAFYNQLMPNRGASAGTKVDLPGQRVKDRPKAKNIIQAMNELGLDISLSRRTQLTPVMVDQFDRIIVMAEKDTIPGYLSTSKKFEFLDIEDPGDMDIENTRLICLKIKAMVEDLVLENYR